MVGRLAGYSDPRIAYRWARPEGNTPAPEALRRLYATQRIWNDVRDTHSTQQTAAWFLAAHPLLQEAQPLQLMLDDRFVEVARVARVTSAVYRPRNGAESQLATGSWHSASLVPSHVAAQSVTRFLGAANTARVTGEHNLKVAYRWVKSSGTPPQGESARRLYLMHRVLVSLTACLPPESVRAWLVAANPALAERSPLEVATADGLHLVVAAADQLVGALTRRQAA